MDWCRRRWCLIRFFSFPFKSIAELLVILPRDGSETLHENTVHLRLEKLQSSTMNGVLSCIIL